MASPIYAQAVRVEDGTITAVGSEQQVKAQSKPEDEYYDLGGRTLMPAFMDAHGHFSGYANSLLQVSLEQAASLDEICEAIRAFVTERDLQPGQWVIAKGYDHNRLAERSHPTRELLDKACPDHPLIVQHQSSHMGSANSFALEQLGIHDDTPSPEGGRIEKKDGRLTGYLEENAFVQALMKVPAPSAKEFLAAVEEAQRRYASYGITTMQEGMLPSSALPFYDLILKNDALWLDDVAYADVRELDAVCGHFPARGEYRKHFRLGGCKMFLDGSPQSRTAWVREPYLGTTDCGYPVLTDEQAYEYVRSAVLHKMQLLTHCNGDAAAAQLLAAYRLAYAEHPYAADLRPVMVHAQLLGLDQISQVRECGVIPSFFVAHVYHWGDTHIRNLGLERASRISPAGTALREGIPFTFHQDAPVIEPDMLETVWCAVERKTKSGVVLGEDQRIPVEEALRAVTVNAAWQYGEELRKGSIELGKQADFALLSKDPLSVDPDALRTLRVCATFQEGREVYRSF